MCGRYRRTTREEELARIYRIPIPPQLELPISYNIAPSLDVLAIRMKDDSPFVFAGLWEGWKDPSTSEWLHTCTIITGEPSELVVEVHTRMPVILPEEHHAKWLGEAQDGDLKELLKPFPAERMKMWPISSRVNSPENDDEAILESIEHDP